MSAATFYNFSRGDKYMSRGRKQVAFDLDTTALKTYYPSDNWNYAYEVIRRHMTNSGFFVDAGFCICFKNADYICGGYEYFR